MWKVLFPVTPRTQVGSIYQDQSKILPISREMLPLHALSFCSDFTPLTRSMNSSDLELTVSDSMFDSERN